MKSGAKMFKKSPEIDENDSTPLEVLPKVFNVGNWLVLFPKEFISSVGVEKGIRNTVTHLTGRPLPLGTRYFIGSLNNR